MLDGAMEARVRPDFAEDGAWLVIREGAEFPAVCLGCAARDGLTRPVRALARGAILPPWTHEMSVPICASCAARWTAAIQAQRVASATFVGLALLDAFGALSGGWAAAALALSAGAWAVTHVALVNRWTVWVRRGTRDGHLVLGGIHPQARGEIAGSRVAPAAPGPSRPATPDRPVDS